MGAPVHLDSLEAAVDLLLARIAGLVQVSHGPAGGKLRTLLWALRAPRSRDADAIMGLTATRANPGAWIQKRLLALGLRETSA